MQGIFITRKIFFLLQMSGTCINISCAADMAELVDALVSGTSGSNALEVRVFLSAPISGVVAQLIERYVRIVEVVGLSPISSTKKNL